MNIELDPVFVRAVRLLHSKSKDSTSQLRELLDSAIRHRKGLGPGPMALLSNSPNGSNSGIKRKSGGGGSGSYENLKADLVEGGVVHSGGGKRQKLDSPRSGHGGFSGTPSPTPPDLATIWSLSGSRGSGGGEKRLSNSPSDEDEFAISGGGEMDLELEGLNDCTCCVCKSFNQSKTNQLMECLTCQNLYHQECHCPPVTSEEADDPRRVWHCSDCKKKTPSLGQIRSSPSSVAMAKATSGLNVLKASPSVGVPFGSSASGSRASPSKSDLSLFKAGGGGSSSSSKSGGSSVGGGTPKSSSSSKSAFSSRSSSSSLSGSSGDRNRLQMMRKKASAVGVVPSKKLK